MFDRLYEFYVKSRAVRFIYQVGFFVSWAAWAAPGLSQGQPVGQEPGKVLELVVRWVGQIVARLTGQPVPEPVVQTVTTVTPQTGDVTWLVFGWLPAIFWPVELVARFLPWAWTNYPIILLILATNFVIGIALYGRAVRLWERVRSQLRSKKKSHALPKPLPAE